MLDFLDRLFNLVVIAVGLVIILFVCGLGPCSRGSKGSDSKDDWKYHEPRSDQNPDIEMDLRKWDEAQVKLARTWLEKEWELRNLIRSEDRYSQLVDEELKAIDFVLRALKHAEENGWHVDQDDLRQKTAKYRTARSWLQELRETTLPARSATDGSDQVSRPCHLEERICQEFSIAQSDLGYVEAGAVLLGLERTTTYKALSWLEQRTVTELCLGIAGIVVAAWLIDCLWMKRRGKNVDAALENTHGSAQLQQYDEPESAVLQYESSNRTYRSTP